MKWPPIHVARANLPPLVDVLPFLEAIWDSRMLSNNGPLLNRFETALAEYLGEEHISIAANPSILSVASRTVDQVLCLPLFFDLDEVSQDLIVEQALAQ